VRYISLFSGIEAATVGWHDMGWNPVVFADFDDFPSAVLKHHYPHVPNAGDVLKHDWTQYRGKADLIVGGSPCQSFSAAGKRLGMDDPRGNLALHYLRIVRDVQPKWFVFENVPGLLSSNGGEDFAIFLGEVEKCGYGFAYRVLDAQYFGVPQRRRRVFVVGCADGDWRSAAAVLFEQESLSGNTEKSKKAWQDSPPFAQTGVSEPKQNDNSRRRIGFVIDSVNSNSMKSGNPKSGCRETDIAPTLDTFPPSPAKNQGGLAIIDKRIVHCEDKAPTMMAANAPGRTGQAGEEENAIIVQKEIGFSHTQGLDCQPSTKHFPTLRAEGGGMAVSIPIHDKATRFRGGGKGRKDDGGGNGFGVGNDNNVMWALTTAENHMVFKEGDHVVRRLTPVECERLQGFPDNYTQIPWKGRPAEECPSSHRYKALGNSMAVPVMRWIGMRIDMLDAADLSKREKSKTTKQMTLW